VRNTLKYVANKDMKSFAKDLKTIYTAADEKTALSRRDAITKKWSDQYPNAMNLWIENWDVITPIFKFSKDVRTAFYTTNAIESVNSSYRLLNRQRSVFPSPQALLHCIWPHLKYPKNGPCQSGIGAKYVANLASCTLIDYPSNERIR